MFKCRHRILIGIYLLLSSSEQFLALDLLLYYRVNDRSTVTLR